MLVPFGRILSDKEAVAAAMEVPGCRNVLGSFKSFPAENTGLKPHADIMRNADTMHRSAIVLYVEVATSAKVEYSAVYKYSEPTRLLHIPIYDSPSWGR